MPDIVTLACSDSERRRLHGVSCCLLTTSDILRALQGHSELRSLSLTSSAHGASISWPKGSLAGLAGLQQLTTPLSSPQPERVADIATSSRITSLTFTGYNPVLWDNADVSDLATRLCSGPIRHSLQSFALEADAGSYTPTIDDLLPTTLRGLAPLLAGGMPALQFLTACVTEPITYEYMASVLEPLGVQALPSSAAEEQPARSAAAGAVLRTAWAGLVAAVAGSSKGVSVVLRTDRNDTSAVGPSSTDRLAGCSSSGLELALERMAGSSNAGNRSAGSSSISDIIDSDVSDAEDNASDASAGSGSGSASVYHTPSHASDAHAAARGDAAGAPADDAANESSEADAGSGAGSDAGSEDDSDAGSDDGSDAGSDVALSAVSWSDDDFMTRSPGSSDIDEDMPPLVSSARTACCCAVSVVGCLVCTSSLVRGGTGCGEASRHMQPLSDDSSLHHAVFHTELWLTMLLFCPHRRRRTLTPWTSGCCTGLCTRCRTG